MNNGVDFAKGRVDPLAVAKATAGFDLPEDVPVYLFVGRLMTYKGLPIILDAMKLLKDAGKDFRMVFIGKGPDGELLEQKARELGLMGTEEKDRCIFVGPIYDRDTLRAWNTRADLFLFPSTFDTNGLVVREAAACGLASVLIEGSCAAEGITDGRNGFTIEENAESMAALLERVGDDRALLREVGSHAMDEIYLSWESCVAEVHRQYERVLAEKAEGLLPKKRTEKSDILVSITARGMEEQAKRRRLRKELFNDFKETAVGMMENFQEASQSAEQFLDGLAEELERGIENLRKE